MEKKQIQQKEEGREFTSITPFSAVAENNGKGRGVAGWLNILAYPVSAFSGFLVWKNHVYQESLGTRERKGDFKDLQEKSKEEYAVINNEIKTNKSLSDLEKREKQYQHRINYDKGREAILKEKGFTNIFHHYKGIASHARDNALISGLTIFGVSLGAMLMVANSKSFLGGKSEEAKDSGISK